MAKTPGRDAVFSLILRQQQYKCAKCDVKQHAIVVRNSDGSYFMCDDFQAEYMKCQGRTPFKVHLRLNFRDGDRENFRIENMYALCPACTATALKQQKKDFKALALQARMKISMAKVINIKNYIAAKTGVELHVRDILPLVELITNNE